MKVYIFCVFSLFYFICFTAAAVSETRDFDSAGLTKVSVQNTSGKTTITASEGAKATVEFTKNTFSDKCNLVVEKKGSVLNLEVKKTGMFSYADCDVDFNVKVPKNVDLDLVVGSGKLAVNGIKGELNFTLGRGDIVADGSFKKIDGKTGSGNIDIKGVTGGGDLKVGSGGINLTFAAEALKGELNLKSGSGSATLLFPKDAKIKTDFKAGSGKLVSELSDNPNADFQVFMKAGSGNLKIKTY